MSSNKEHNCEVCMMVLNSSEQFMAHIMGASHSKKLKEKMQAADSESITTQEGMGFESGQDQVTIKTEVKVKKEDTNTPKPPVDDKKLLASQVKTKMKQGMWCPVCDIPLTSGIVAEAHYKGKKHMSKASLLKLVSGVKQENIDQVNHSSAVKEENDGDIKKKNIRELRCDLCDVSLTSESMARAHYEGSKHIKKVAKLKKDSGPQGDPGTTEQNTKYPIVKQEIIEDSSTSEGALKESPQIKATDISALRCDVCDVALGGESNAKSHYQGKQHLKKLAKLKQEDTEQNTEGPSVKKQRQDQPVVKEVITVTSWDELHAIFEVSCSKTLITPNMYSGPVSNDVDAWIRSKEVVCGVCIAKIGSKENGLNHFHGRPHNKRAFSAERAARNPDKWCRVCLVKLDSPAVITKHYDGQEHRSKVKLVNDLGLQDKTLKLKLLSHSLGDFEEFSPEPKPGDKRASSSEDMGSPRKLPKDYSPEKIGMTGQHYCSFCDIFCNTHDSLMKHRRSEKHAFTVSIRASEHEVQQQQRNLHNRPKRWDIPPPPPPDRPVGKFEYLDVAKKFMSPDK